MGRKKILFALLLALLIVLSTACGREEYVVEYGVDGYVYLSKRVKPMDFEGEIQVVGDYLYYMENIDGGAAVKRISVAALASGRSRLDFSHAETVYMFKGITFELPEGAGKDGDKIDFLSAFDNGSIVNITGRKDLEKEYGKLSLAEFTVSPGGNLYCYLNTLAGVYLDMDVVGGMLYGQTLDGEQMFRMYLPEMKDLAVDAEGRVFVLAGDEIRVLDREGNQMGRISTDGCGAGKMSQEEFFVDSEGRVYYTMLNEKQVRVTYQVVGEGTLCLENAGDFLGDRYVSCSAAPDGGVFQFGRDSILYKYDRETGSSRKVLDWRQSDLMYSGVCSVAEITPDILLVNYSGYFTGEGGIYQLTRTAVEDLPEREMLVIASPLNSVTLQRAIMRFNAENNTYRAVVDSYGASISAEEKKWICPQLDAALVSQRPPDLLDLSVYNIPKYAQKGLLEDLNPYIERSNILDKGDIPNNILEGLTFDGKLVCIPLSFNVSGIVARASQLAEMETWTMEDVYRLTERHPESIGGAVDYGVGLRAQADWFLGEFCACYYLEEYVDWEGWKCSFDSEGFRSLVEWVGKYAWTPEHMGEQLGTVSRNPVYIPKDVLMVSQEWLHFSTPVQYELQFGEEVAIKGYPTTDGREYFPADISDGLGIASNSLHKDGAWEFIECYMQVNGSLFGGMPASKAKLREEYEDETTPQYKGSVPGGSGEAEMVRKGDALVESDLIPYYVVPKEQADAILNAIENADFRPMSETEEIIIQIVVEEAESYCCGDKSLEEVTRLIQNRVQLLLDEMKP